MLNEIASPPSFNKQEPIPGYIIKELIGTGGYGEVWKAHAPGGLLKAVKFVYGSVNSKRASRELRALNRIKEVRHAFLLSIERIEVIDGNVIIVTELADQSLKEHFEKCQASGQYGIPRPELLGYLRDASDALDYIYENYSLQHLDIKPENLLLVGNRTKVADFGLIKNLYDRSASLIEGLTPIYSPPELFEGKPNRHSDQYSLAIVYQEMLTGELPFDGQTAAHLAAQHLQNAPKLTALPKCDQPVIARALSKNPDERFPSCRAMVAALNARRGEQVERTHRKSLPAQNVFKTEPIGEEPIQRARDQAIAGPAPQEAMAQLPSIDLNGEATTQHGPVLFVGIGGVATRVLHRLRRRFHDRLGAMDSLPAFEFLLLDTDVKSINRATEGEIGSALNGSETLAMPLRRTENYRSSAGKILHSISRRWLYNIPFSLQTEGFRPLGRLAMIDHSGRLMERLRQAITNITHPDNVAATARSTGLDISSRQPRVFVIASVSGGTGGGMVLDVAYAVRSILAEFNLSDEHVCGILMHATPRSAGERDKAIANTYSTLSELWHYSRAGHFYPGDSACNVPAFHGDNRTFASCYFVHLGDDLNEQRLDAATDPVAEYLYSNSVTPANGFFEKCRQIEQSVTAVASTEPVLRTFGLCQLGGSNSDIPTLLAELLCRDLVCTWRSGMPAALERKTPRLSETMALIAAHDQRSASRFSEVDQDAAAKAAELEFDLAAMREVAREVLDQEVSSDIESYLVKLIGEAFEAHQAAAERKDVSPVFAIVDSVLGDGGADENSNDGRFDSLGTVLKTRLEGRAGKLSVAVRDWIFNLIDAHDVRVEGAKHGAEWFQNHLRTLERTAITKANLLREQILAIKEAALSEQAGRRATAAASRPDAKWLREAQQRLFEYARLRLEQVMTSVVARWLRLVERQVTAALDQLQEFWKDLNKLAGTFHVAQSLEESFDNCAAPDVVHSHWRSLLGELMGHRQELVTALDRAIEEELALGHGKLRHFMAHPSDIPSQLSAPLRATARGLVLRAMETLNMSRLSDSSRDSASFDSSEFRRCVEAAKPYLVDPTAAGRLLLVMPQSIDQEGIRASLPEEDGSPATIVHTTGGDLIACQEVEQLHIRRVANQLVENRKDYIEIAKRLHTRIDVDWDDMSSGARGV